MFHRIILSFLSIPVVFIILHTIIRIVRSFYKFPMPEFAANIIDNPFRRKFQPPDETAVRHRITAGMQVLDVGPGNGTYTLAAARKVGPEGKVVAIDIQPKMIERLQNRIVVEGVRNIEARVADAYDLPFDTASFDLVYMITVINEIPDIPRALSEFQRVLKPTGKLVFSEILLDPDYPLAGTLTQTVQAASFLLKEKIGGFFYYTLIFEKKPVT